MRIPRVVPLLSLKNHFYRCDYPSNILLSSHECSNLIYLQFRHIKTFDVLPVESATRIARSFEPTMTSRVDRLI
jgi:hypothetical protein